ncbi:hypothetical protein MNO14_01670 [Luteimonas sp. S4-F44]|uniref:hypothetical protein n=1 Tax=Luteimonas sp. S4-F44 TaxID=2925842 RepID=UPI001F536E74|nr:hypothetical protein [Luteimonas sp. S4-F44]UNK42843.1 hypothetical protein MNO14_01670 [Luteimonas sp. S4-F44]
MRRTIEFGLTPEMAEAIARSLPPIPQRRRSVAWLVATAAAGLAAAVASAWRVWG